MELNKLYEYDIVKSMDGIDEGISEIKTGCICVALSHCRLNISIENGKLKIYKIGDKISSVTITPQTSNMILIS